MYRKAIDFLKDWKNKQGRKPIIIRGARQTGKSTLVKIFAKQENLDLLEINFEINPEYYRLFENKHIDDVVQAIEVEFGSTITDNKTLIFLDEIQMYPELIRYLRHFHEIKKNVFVIAAGSLLDFVLADHTFSMPVGRVEYLFLGPMSFEEYLIAKNETKLLEFISNYTLSDTIPVSIHDKAIQEMKTWAILGGMPEVIRTWINEQSHLYCDRIKHSIINTIRDDFAKYKQKANTRTLQKLFNTFPAFVGKKIVYSKIDSEKKSRDIIHNLEMLENARIIYRVAHTSGSGIPLGAEKNDKRTKGLFLDVGLLSSILGLDINDITHPEALTQINGGVIAEQIIGQHLLYMNNFYKLPELFYWNREKSQSSAEIDFLVNKGQQIIPIEVKAGKTGTLRSLHQFMKMKSLQKALRFYTDIPNSSQVAVTIQQKKVNYELVSLPLYLIEQWKRFV